MLLKENDLKNLERKFRLNLINSITGVKPANLVGTTSNEKQDNLAIFSSIVHLGSNPAQIGMVTRPQVETMKDTFSNIMETKYYTINHISAPFVAESHVKIGMRHLQNIELPNGCIFIIGEIVIIQLSKELINEKGHLDLQAYHAVGISGLNSYYALQKIDSFPYVRVNEIPNFNA